MFREFDEPRKPSKKVPGKRDKKRGVQEALDVMQREFEEDDAELAEYFLAEDYDTYDSDEWASSFPGWLDRETSEMLERERERAVVDILLEKKD